jgi:DNA-directed RNA polymerase subunit N (RpoN/RPB10)
MDERVGQQSLVEALETLQVSRYCCPLFGSLEKLRVP